MNVIYDYQSFSNQGHSGIVRYFIELVARLNEDPSCHARIVSPIARSPMLAEHWDRVPTVGFDLSALTMVPDRTARLVNEVLFRGYVAISAPDIVHETDYGPRRTAPRTSKIVTTIHDTIPDRLPHIFGDNKRGHAQKQAAIDRADSVICVSESTRKDLVELYDVNPDRVSVAHLGSSFAPSEGTPIDVGARFFLHVGSRYPYKNFNAIVQAFGSSQLHRTHYLVSFTSIPFGPVEFEAIDRSGVPRSRVVRVSGDDRMLARYYAQAEALVYPSLYEGFGIPLLEAMRCSCPIITSNVSSMPEVAGDAALYVDPADVSSIADALRRMTSFPQDRADLLGRGLERAQQFSWSRCAAATYSVYRNVLSNRMRR